MFSCDIPRVRPAQLVGTLAATAGAALVLMGCGSSSSSSEKPASSQSGDSASVADIKLGVATASVNDLSLWVGQSQGLFTKQKLKVDVTILDTTQAIIAGLASGSVHYAAFPAAGLIQGVNKGVPIISIAQVNQGKNEGLVVTKDFAAKHGLSLKSPPATIAQALCGSVVAGIGPVLQGNLNVFLSSVGQKPSCVKYLSVQNPAAGITALSVGHAAAYIGSQPTPYQLDEQGKGVLVADTTTVPAWNGDFLNIVLVANKAYAKAHPDLTKRLVSAVDQASAYVAQNPDQSLQVLKKQLPSFPETALSKTIGPAKFATSATQTAATWNDTLTFAKSTGEASGDATVAEGSTWTNEYVPQS
jgi:ABC-type nitrate/sulfonate/bicarbonate transport system substrate-binding protein